MDNTLTKKNYSFWENLMRTKILGFPLPIYLLFSAIMMIIAIQGSLLDSMVGAWGFALIVGTLIGWIGDRIPIWKDWCGGGMLLTSLAAGALVTFNILPESTVNTISNWNGTMGFLDLYILVLITGAIMTIDRKLLMKAFAGFLPSIVGATALSFLFTAVVALIVGQSPLEALINIALPIMGGGNGAGTIPMSQMWGQMTGNAPEKWYAPAFAIMSLGNLVSVIMAALLDRLGKKYPKMTGNGKMFRSVAIENTTVEDYGKDIKVSVLNYASGFALALFLFILADFYASSVSLINNMDLGFEIHKFAFMVIFASIFNVLGFIPQEIRLGAQGMQGFFSKYMSFPLMMGVGITTNLMDYVDAFTVPNMLMILACVFGAILGAVLVGYPLGFYPVEIAITAGLDMAGGGGAGDVQILGASHRMQLMPYAQISSRIGGALILVIASIMFGLL